MRNLFITLLLVKLCLGRGDCEPRHTPVELSLRSALEIAIRQNPDFQVVDQDVEVARALVEVAQQRPNPSLGYFLPVGRAEQKQKVVFNIPLETGGRRQARIVLAEDGTKEAELRRRQAELSLKNNARKAFVELAVARLALEQAQRQIAFLDQLVKVATRRFEDGDVAEAEIIRATFEREQLRRTIYPAELRLKQAQVTLNRLLGFPLLTNLQTIDDDILFPDGPIQDSQEWLVPEVTDLIELARANRPDLMLTAQQVQSAKDRVRLAKALQSPDVSLQASLIHDPVLPSFAYQVGVQVELPWGSNRRGEVRNAEASVEVAQLQRRVALAEAERSVISAYENYLAARRQMKHDLGVLAPLAGQVLKLSELIYELGEGDITQVLVASQSVLQQRRIYLADVLQFHIAIADLEMAVNANLIGDKP